MLPIEYEFVIGDPTPMGWLTVGLYFLTMVFAFLCTFKKYGAIDSHQKIFWWLMVLLFMFLGVNKQLDLQSFFTELARYYANRDGWYQDRRQFQVIAIGAFVLFIFVFMFEIVMRLHRAIKQNFIAIIGVFVLCSFVAVRALSFHNIDILISSTYMGLKLNWILEISGILLVMLNALKRIFKKHE